MRTNELLQATAKAAALAAGLASAAPVFAAEATSAQLPPPPPPDVTTNVNTATPPPAPPPPPYSLPWQLRPVTAATVVRLDTSIALYESTNAAFKSADDAGGESVASLLLASYKLTPEIAPLVRVGVVQNSEPGPKQGQATAFINPIVGVTYAKKLSGPFRVAGFLGAALPLGMGGDKPPARDGSDTAKAVRRGIQARSGMDNAMFAVNYTTGILGFGGAYIANKLTIQLEATLLQLFRTRNESIAADADKRRTNLTSGLHVGYFLAPFISVGAEYRYQRWLTTPVVVQADAAARETQTLAIGPRFHFKAGTTWLRPGISYATGLDKPLTNEKYHMVQVDIPAVF